MKVNLNEVLNSNEYRNNSYKLPIALGKTENNENIVIDLASAPHLLVAGSTGSGKSVCLDSIILSLSRRDDVKLVLVDTKIVGFSIYNGLSSLLFPVCTDDQDVENKLNYLIEEMNARYYEMAKYGVRDLDSYIKETGNELDRIVLIIDEYADLMLYNKNIGNLIQMLVQKSRACGIHIILSTQRPSTEVVTGMIKANIPARIALSVSSAIDSRVILGTSGAENLKGNGDMIYSWGRESVHLQGSYVSDSEIREYVKQNR